MERFCMRGVGRFIILNYKEKMEEKDNRKEQRK
jgi:hypothetical protein